MELQAFPHSLDAERALLGGLLVDPDQVLSIAEVIKPDDFYREAHGRVFQWLLNRAERNEPIELMGLIDHVQSTGASSQFGGVAYLSSLPEQVPSTDNLGYYAQLVRDKAVRRRLLQVAGQIQSRAQGADELPVLLDFAEQRVFELSQQQSQQDWFPIHRIIEEEWERLEQRSRQEGDVTGITTGFSDLDHILSGLQRSDLIILAARPAMGKTALALNIAQNAAILGSGAVGVGVFSLEMSRGQLVTRMLCTEARVQASRVKTGMLTDEDWRRVEGAAERLAALPLWIVDSPNLGITDIRAKARRLKAEHPELSLIIIDYLQLMQGTPGSREPREQQISTISRGLKGLAKELDLPVIALSQLNRGVEKREDKRPLVSDLRESGAIEQDADIIMFIYRDEYYNKDSEEQGVAEVIIAKQRNGATGTIKLAFEGQFVRFDNLAQSTQLDGGYA